MAYMGKADEIKAFNKFMDALPEDSYFNDLKDFRAQIVRNIESDSPAFVGIFVDSEHHEERTQIARDIEVSLETTIQELQVELAEAKEWDIRTLIATEKELVKVIEEEAKALAEVRNKIKGGV